MANEKNTLCRHSKVEIYEDSEGRGHFGECLVCEGIGPLKLKASDARKALLKLRVERPTNAGGVREGAGRKKKLPDNARFCAFTLLPANVNKIDAFIKAFNKDASEHRHLKSRSAALRKILKELKVPSNV